MNLDINTRKGPRLLDCTLRDGGFYTSWDFDEAVVRSYLNVISQSGVDIVEMGYRSILANEFYGMLKYSDDTNLEWLKEFANLEYALMVDLKEFVKGDSFDGKLFRAAFRKSSLSNFHWIRVAIVDNLVRHCAEALQILKDEGYKTTVNLMQISLMNDDAIKRTAEYLNKTSIDVFYFADSFGGMLPKDVKKYFSIIRDHFDGQLGVHFHDNLGLAFANSLASIENGVDYLDSTIYGMGRGAGNLKTESILLYLRLAEGAEHLTPNVLVDFIENHVKKFWEKYRWGPSFNYALAGLKNIHPMYCQKLEELQRYSGNKFLQVLESIPTENRSRYSSKELEKAVVRGQEGSTDSSYLSSVEIEKLFGREEEIVVIGTGPSTRKYMKAIQNYLNSVSPFVVQCNLDDSLTYDRGFAAVLHEKHLLGRDPDSIKKAVVFGNCNLFENTKIVGEKHYFRYRITPNSFAASQTEVCVPFDVVSMYALGLSMLLRPKRIVLVGFDGYRDSLHVAADYIRQEEMAKFFALCTEKVNAANVELFSATPTSYDVPCKSIFYLLSHLSHAA